MPILPIPKGTLHYQVRGPEGAPWLTILPGAATGIWVYEPIQEKLCDEFRVVTLDYRGMGLSRNDLWQSPPARLAEDVLLLLDHLGIAKTHIANYSLGTLVGAELLHKAPTRVDRVAIGCMPVVRGKWELPEGARDALPEDVSEITDFAGIKALVMPMFLSPWFRRTHPEQYKAMVERSMAQTTRETLTSMQQFTGVFCSDWGRYRVYGTLPKDRRLFLSGEKDHMALPRDLREHPFTSLGPTVIFRESGHIFFWEQMESYCAILRHFLRTGQPPSPLPGDGMVVLLPDLRTAPEARA